jgi:hypothetical protein
MGVDEAEESTDRLVSDSIAQYFLGSTIYFNLGLRKRQQFIDKNATSQSAVLALSGIITPGYSYNVCPLDTLMTSPVIHLA